MIDKDSSWPSGNAFHPETRGETTAVCDARSLKHRSPRKPRRRRESANLWDYLVIAVTFVKNV